MLKKILIILIIVTLSLAAVLFFTQSKEFKHQSTSLSVNPDTTYQQPLLEYGIPVDSFIVSNYVIQWNQTLGSIMESLNVAAEHIRQIEPKSKDIFDIRKIRAGNAYKVFTQSDSNAKVEYLVYEHTQVDYVIFHFSDSLLVSVGQRNIVPITRISEAEISSSLWEAMNIYNLNPILALDLSDIFAWTVDFFGLYPGDKFKAIYDELFVGDKSVGIGTIHAAWFEHRGEKYYAYRYMQDSVWSYWDEKGNSLRKAFLKAPLRFSRISSGFSNRRMHPVLKIYRPHTGVDYAAPEGTPVVAIGDGVVIEKGYNNAAGNYVKIRHNSVYTTGYNHFSRFGKDVAKGGRVQQGQVIGYVGKTGYATGPHLDMRFWKNGKPIDPLKVEAPPVEPISKENHDIFMHSISSYQVKLDSISLRPVFPKQNAFAWF
ncbi:MAG: peptidoglycan DD-metalloendopeptidase family protein [Tenuifilaceae bacterium]|nr:peptidoglycan DD-metalloendopeptidase family protein [Tenuifilaceae bacterium]